MGCREPTVETCHSTGVATATCGNRARISAILAGAGALLNARIWEEPGGNTITAAPIPAWRDRESFSNPIEKPTMSRMSVTSSAIATMLMAERRGRCARLETIILFIMKSSSQPLANDCRFQIVDSRLEQLRIPILRSDTRLKSEIQNLQSEILVSTAAVGRGLRSVQMDYLRPCGLLQHKLLVIQWPVHIKFNHGERNVVFFFRAADFDPRWE